jgi:hypothetical protein
MRLQHWLGREPASSRSATRAHFWLTGDLDAIRRAHELPDP